MSLFKDVTLVWKGDEYVVPSENVMKLIAKVEDCITLAQLTSDNGVPPAKLSMAYAVALRHAGCRNVTQEDIYKSLFVNGNAQNISDAVGSLIMLMIPPETYQPKVDQAKKPKPKARKKAT